MADEIPPIDRAPSTEEEIHAARIGPPTLLNGPIHSPSTIPSGPASSSARPTASARPSAQRALLVEHTGSTSVPGLAAKPLIDILLVVPDSADEPAYVPALEAAGYVLRIREPDWYQHRVFKGPDTDVNLHVFSDGCEEIDRILLFRDRLRTDDADRALYERTKRDLARRTWKYTQNYADAKSAVVEAIIARSRAAQPDRIDARPT